MDTRSTDTATLPIQFGVPLDQSSLAFFVCLVAALALVYLYCRQKFNEPSSAPSDEFVYQLLPRQLATHEEYAKGFLAYFGAMAGVVLLLSLIGPKNLGEFGIVVPQGVANGVVPIFVALIVVGVMPTVPVLQGVERMLRKYAHERAYIPASALATAERLSAAGFDFAAFRDALQAPEMRGVLRTDFDQPRRNLEHDWARLSCLVYELRSRRLTGDFNGLDGGLLRSYERDLQGIEASRDRMEALVRAVRAERRRDPAYSNKELRAAIRGELHKIYILLACAVRLKKQPLEDVDLTLRSFGFVLPRVAAAPSNGDLKLVGLIVIAAGVLALELGAVALGKLHLWELSIPFPQVWTQPFIDATWAMLPHAAAIMVADLVREHRKKRGRWIGFATGNFVAAAADHVRVTLACGVAGCAALVLWGLAFQSFTELGAQLVAPYALLAMATGGFYVFHLDNAEAGRRPPRWLEAGGQALATGFAGLIAATMSFDVLSGIVGPAPDSVALAASVSLAIGLMLGWYIPAAANAARRHPQSEAREERVRVLEIVAQRHFGDDGRAADWLATQAPALGNKTPVLAAAEIAGFENALNLLNGPPAVQAQPAAA